MTIRSAASSRAEYTADLAALRVVSTKGWPSPPPGVSLADVADPVGGLAVLQHVLAGQRGRLDVVEGC